MPYYELRTKLAMQGKNPDQIADGVQTAYARGELPKRDGRGWSPGQRTASLTSKHCRPDLFAQVVKSG
jgi:hypothetical protein